MKRRGREGKDFLALIVLFRFILKELQVALANKVEMKHAFDSNVPLSETGKSLSCFMDFF